MSDCLHIWKELRPDTDDEPVSTVVCVRCGTWVESEYKGMRAVDE